MSVQKSYLDMGVWLNEPDPSTGWLYMDWGHLDKENPNPKRKVEVYPIQNPHIESKFVVKIFDYGFTPSGGDEFLVKNKDEGLNLAKNFMNIELSY